MAPFAEEEVWEGLAYRTYGWVKVTVQEELALMESTPPGFSSEAFPWYCAVRRELASAPLLGHCAKMAGMAARPRSGRDLTFGLMKG